MCIRDRFFDCFLCIICTESFQTGKAFLSGSAAGDISVSYTHLDVYKRQVYYSNDNKKDLQIAVDIDDYREFYVKDRKSVV